MDAKPADFFIGVVDFFGVLLPGILLAALLSPHQDRFFDGFDLKPPSGDGWTVAAMVVAGYVLGHLLKALGEPLDRWLYDKMYLPTFKRRPPMATRAERIRWVIHVGRGESIPQERDTVLDPLLAAAEALADRHVGRSIKRNTFSVAEDYVRIRSTEAYAAVERLIADSKFFRSLLILAAISFVVAATHKRPSIELTFALLIVAGLSAWQYLRLRWKATNALYQSYVLLANNPELGSS